MLKMETKDENTVIIQSNIDLDQNEIDLITMFFESKKQSGGGDTTTSEQIGKRLLKLNFEENEAKKRILDKKYFSFKKYQFKSYAPGIMGYQNDSYAPITNLLVIKDVFLDSDFESSNYDDSVIKMYAEHLSPDNEVVRIQKSHLIENTFYIHYKDALDANHVQKRYAKKSKLRNQTISIFDCFNTKSFIIASKMQKISNIWNTINEQMEKRNLVQNFFMDKTDFYVLVQSEEEKTFHELKDLMKLSLKSIAENLVIEDIHNFDLLNFIKGGIKKENEIKSEELEIIETQQVFDSEMVDEPTKTVKISRADLKRKANAEKANMERTEKKIENYLSIEKIRLNKLNLDSLFKSQTDSEIVLNEDSPFSIALFNCPQLRDRVRQLLVKHKATLYFNKKNKFKPLVLKFSKESLDKLINAVKSFAANHFIYQIVHLNSVNDSNKILKDVMSKFFPIISKQFPGVYMNINNNLLHCYGYPKSIGRILKPNFGLLSEIMDKCRASFKQPVQLVLEETKTEQIEQDSFNEQTSKKPRTSSLISQADAFTDTEEDNEKSKWEVKSNVIKSVKTLYTDENRIVLYDSFEPIEAIESIEKQEYNKNNFVLVDSSLYKVLSICLKKCKKICLDFIDDLKLISNECKLVYVKGENDSIEECGVIIQTNEEKYLETYKAELEKIFDFYEKNRLKHIYNLIDPKLKGKEIFSTLISNFSSKNELNDLKIILNMIYLDDKVVHAELTDKKLIEVYGYTNAVQNYDNYAIDILKKTMHRFKADLNSLLAFKLRQKENPKIGIFFKFDGNYFNDFVMQVTAYEAHVIKIDDQKAIHIACFNKKIRNNAHNLQFVESVYNWRESIDAFVYEYLELFGIEQFKVPFTRNSQECQSILYDKNVLDVSWIDENEIEVVGIKQEIEKFKFKLL